MNKSPHNIFIGNEQFSKNGLYDVEKATYSDIMYVMVNPVRVEDNVTEYIKVSTCHKEVKRLLERIEALKKQLINYPSIVMKNRRLEKENAMLAGVLSGYIDRIEINKLMGDIK